MIILHPLQILHLFAGEAYDNKFGWFCLSQNFPEFRWNKRYDGDIGIFPDNFKVTEDIRSSFTIGLGMRFPELCKLGHEWRRAYYTYHLTQDLDNQAKEWRKISTFVLNEVHSFNPMLEKNVEKIADLSNDIFDDLKLFKDVYQQYKAMDSIVENNVMNLLENKNAMKIGGGRENVYETRRENKKNIQVDPFSHKEIDRIEKIIKNFPEIKKKIGSVYQAIEKLYPDVLNSNMKEKQEAPRSRM